jgi:hypothetical protein
MTQLKSTDLIGPGHIKNEIVGKKSHVFASIRIMDSGLFEKLITLTLVKLFKMNENRD